MKRLIFSLMVLVMIMSFVSAEPIRLSNITVQTNQTWKFNVFNDVVVQTVDFNGTAIDVMNVSITLLENVNHSQQKLYRSDVGKYVQAYLINESNISTVHFQVDVIERGKVVSEEITITFEEKTNLEKFYGKVKVYWKNTMNLIAERIDDYWIQAIILIFASLTIIVFIDLFIRRKKK